jgi:DNA-binding NarL/FixJ family response regulator
MRGLVATPGLPEDMRRGLDESTRRFSLTAERPERRLGYDSLERCPLTARELDVLALLARGVMYKQIARELSVGRATVRTHLHNIYRKLDVRDRAQAVFYATGRGWVPRRYPDA